MPKNKKSESYDDFFEKNEVLYHVIRNILSNCSSEMFRHNHVIIKGEPGSVEKKLRIAERDVSVSTAILFNRPIANQFLAEISYIWRDVASREEANEIRTNGEYRWTNHSYKAFVWSEDRHSPGWTWNVYIEHSIVWSDRLGKCVIHHINDISLTPYSDDDDE